MATIITASGNVTGVSDDTITTDEIPLYSVDLSARKVPLIHRVDLELYWDGMNAGAAYYTAALVSNDDVDDLTLVNRGVVANMQVLSNLVTGGSQMVVQPTRMLEFQEPIAVAASSLYVAVQSDAIDGDPSRTVVARVRIFYQAKVVSSSQLVALLSA